MEKLSLDGNWGVTQKGTAQSLPAQVPGCIHTDLLAAGKIPDPFYRDQELAVQWIGEVDWIYSRQIEIPASFLNHEAVRLRCEGLDTLATLSLNGREVGRADNMFRTWEFDVKPLLGAGTNSIEVRFASTLPYIQAREKERRLPNWNARHEVTGRSWVRKEPCNYGWDWGPVLITCGIWRPISLAAFDTARLTGVQILQDHTTAGQVVLTVSPEVESLSSTPLSAAVRVVLEGRVVAQGSGPADQPVKLVIRDPQLWWPNRLGTQPLYAVEVELQAAGQVLDRTARRIGLRTLRLDRHPDEWGESFQFVVNGVPFFAKGSNWIPADAFATRLTPEAYRGLLQSAADANMNMLRVWGGGIYENDVFYNLCDELGLCIWHDFMFACASYPAFDEAFMRNVRAEAEDTVRRLRHHPSIALWCGNNELEQGLVGPAWTDRQMSWDDYGRLFDHLLPEVTRALDPQRDYWPSSPHTPHGDRADFNNPSCGDAHLWDVWHGRKPFEWYRTCTHRFNSEFGFQSFPEPKTVYGYTEPQDRNVTTYVMEHHQRSGIGNTVIMQYLLDWFRLPTSFEHNLWLSQILHGMAMQYAVEHWRRSMPRGMGTLYWQINDCWPVASWASIDYHGRWKALHYLARRFYAPVLVSGVEDWTTGTVEVHLTNDRREAVSGEIGWWLTGLDGRPLAAGRTHAAIEPQRSRQIETLDFGPQLMQFGPRQLMVWLEFAVKGERLSTNFASFARPKHLDLAEPGIDLVVEPLGAEQYAVTLSAAKPALWAWLELDGAEARFSDNFVHLRPGRSQRIVATTGRALPLDQFRAGLRVSSLVDTYRVCS
jgi:beta-mannosidase